MVAGCLFGHAAPFRYHRRARRPASSPDRGQAAWAGHRHLRREAAHPRRRGAKAADRASDLRPHRFIRQIDERAASATRDGRRTLQLRKRLFRVLRAPGAFYGKQGLVEHSHLPGGGVKPRSSIRGRKRGNNVRKAKAFLQRNAAPRPDRTRGCVNPETKDCPRRGGKSSGIRLAP